MRGQRPAGSAPCAAAAAESLPFQDQSFDVAMAVSTVHPWGTGPDSGAARDAASGPPRGGAHVRHRARSGAYTAPVLDADADALTDIHRAGLAHRDPKPSNVLPAEDGVRVVDFGIARAAEGQTALTRIGAVRGSPFMSPEQAQESGRA
jgi:hypothetical protein